MNRTSWRIGMLGLVLVMAMGEATSVRAAGPIRSVASVAAATSDDWAFFDLASFVRSLFGGRAINPQPLPPGRAGAINPQPLPPGRAGAINPQPLPPGSPGIR